jgi:hypothetical protein
MAMCSWALRSILELASATYMACAKSILQSDVPRPCTYKDNASSRTICTVQVLTEHYSGLADPGLHTAGLVPRTSLKTAATPIALLLAYRHLHLDGASARRVSPTSLTKPCVLGPKSSVKPPCERHGQAPTQWFSLAPTIFKTLFPL